MKLLSSLLTLALVQCAPEQWTYCRANGDMDRDHYESHIRTNELGEEGFPQTQQECFNYLKNFVADQKGTFDKPDSPDYGKPVCLQYNIDNGVGDDQENTCVLYTATNEGMDYWGESSVACSDTESARRYLEFAAGMSIKNGEYSWDAQIFCPDPFGNVTPNDKSVYPEGAGLSTNVVLGIGAGVMISAGTVVAAWAVWYYLI